jgi:hypothetical protein
MWELLHLIRQPPISDKGRPPAWSAFGYRPMLLGWRLGRRIWARAAQAAGTLSDVGAWLGTRHCGAPVGLLPLIKGFAGGGGWIAMALVRSFLINGSGA